MLLIILTLKIVKILNFGNWKVLLCIIILINSLEINKIVIIVKVYFIVNIVKYIRKIVSNKNRKVYLIKRIVRNKIITMAIANWFQETIHHPIIPSTFILLFRIP
jgi:hypothetical protein